MKALKRTFTSKLTKRGREKAKLEKAQLESRPKIGPPQLSAFQPPPTPNPPNSQPPASASFSGTGGLQSSIPNSHCSHHPFNQSHHHHATVKENPTLDTASIEFQKPALHRAQSLAQRGANGLRRSAEVRRKRPKTAAAPDTPPPPSASRETSLKPDHYLFPLKRTFFLPPPSTIEDSKADDDGDVLSTDPLNNSNTDFNRPDLKPPPTKDPLPDPDAEPPSETSEKPLSHTERFLERPTFSLPELNTSGFVPPPVPTKDAPVDAIESPTEPLETPLSHSSRILGRPAFPPRVEERLRARLRSRGQTPPQLQSTSDSIKKEIASLDQTGHAETHKGVFATLAQKLMGGGGNKFGDDGDDVITRHVDYEQEREAALKAWYQRKNPPRPPVEMEEVKGVGVDDVYVSPREEWRRQAAE